MFVNIGGYSPTSMQEKHEFGLVIAKSKLEAKNIAKSKWLIGYKKKHKDDISSLEMLFSCEDCELINKIGNWEIELTPDNKFIQENNYPDWYGYKKIDGK
jgi:predicted membrane protein